ncbi:peptidase M16 domain protein [Thermobaculum terrenum ATCC BAA-798]|uniref:Peptidase M16 domain protein n=1 Tax=Thermobaculum terrenum (strain ATCC BAA-798 / CCMEE 7001 / YNP1) TaxID=525904 RepID=D1CDU4_THET1|nr:pitrilysin family protein [Thermobaculum terrenum]ACZ41100.1 peptidase M16 domain protein [Thermobaculum terrenum ATCC BAA-798]
MPEQYKDVLPNGLTVLGERLEGVRSLALGFIVGAGSSYDPDDKSGLAHFTETMLLEGTTNRTSRQISDSLDSLGVSYGTSLDAETIGLSGVMVSSRLEPALEIFADILQNPSFPEDEMEQTRSSILQELRREEDEPMVKVRDLLRRVYYEGHPYSKRPTGEPDVISSLSSADLREYHASYFNPANTVCAAAGDLDWDLFRSLVEKFLGGWKPGTKAPEIGPPHPRPQLYVENQQTQQEHIAGAAPSVPFGHDDYYAAIIAAEILGGGMSSRLFVEVREKRGLVYSVGASYSPGRYQGSWRIYAGTTPERASQTYSVLMEELHKLDSEGVSEEEFRRFQALTRSHVLMAGESTSARLRSLLTSWWYEGRIKPLSYIRERIDAVTVDQVNKVVREWPLSSNLVLCALGPSTKESLVGENVSKV